ncbi:hypothetical protein BDQ12DRAFT_727025 [Crucibulum laeve]|uniref:Uncharacterized protein n=1 Tax=Crucibulum laeve TaxID=68775 RepID=A0A5C3LND3_9AGAR|nr:hypothetical protein BDQ12DRAFT_727025 [Crucibulum laeve]
MSSQDASRFQTSLVDNPVSQNEGTQGDRGQRKSALGTSGNYPLPGDSTASGGYGSTKNVWSDKAQRGNPPENSTHSPSSGNSNDNGLIDQTATGGPIGDELEDAKQGRDHGQVDLPAGDRSDYHPSKESRSEAQDMLDSGYSRERE